MFSVKASVFGVVMFLFCIWLLRPLAIHLGFIDHPNHRKHHEIPTPLIGGVALFFGFCFALLVLDISLASYRGLFAATAILILMGMVDDFRELGSKLRLLGQCIAGLLMIIWGNHSLTHLGNLFFLGEINTGMWALPLTLLVLIANFNAMNMVDGQDGLAGGIALGQAALLLYLSHYLGFRPESIVLSIFIVLLIVYLFFNFPLPWRKHASIFLGDSGSTFLAAVLAWFALKISQADITLIKPMIVLWIMSFPLFDLLNVTVHRLAERKPILVASRDHMHHILHVAGVNQVISTLVLCGFSCSLGVLGIALNGWGMQEGWQFFAWVFILILYLVTVSLVRRKQN